MRIDPKGSIEGIYEATLKKEYHRRRQGSPGREENREG
jgi:hypothetical protein